MEDNEVEEGEACCYHMDGAIIDPDKSFSYIEEKVHNLLGHHVKDFGGEFSAENLGARFGGYGSFLPMYQRSPSGRPQQKTPQRVQTYTMTRSLLDMNSEGTPQHSHVPSDVPLFLRPGTSRSTNLLLGSKVASVDVSATRDSCKLPLSVADKFPSKHKSSAAKLVNPSDQPSLKVRIKVGSGNKARKNTAIYSGLGLTSPSSTENSPARNDQMPIGSPGMPCESPGTILQNMTSFPVPGSLLLSPLHESMLCLMKKEKKLVLPIKDQQKNSFMFEDDSPSKPGDGDVLKEKKKKAQVKSVTPELLNYGNAVKSEDNMTFHSKKTMGEVTIESKKRPLSDLKIKLSSYSITGNSLNDSVRSPEAVPVKKREIKKERASDKLLTTNMPKKESLTSSYNEDCGKHGQLDAESSSMELINEQKSRSSCKGFSVVHRDGGGTKGSRAPLVSKAASKGAKDSIATAMTKAGLNSTGDELDGRKVVKEKLPFEGKKKSKTSENNDKSAGNLMEERQRFDIQASKKDQKAALKVVKEKLPTCDKAEGRKLEAMKEKEALNDGSSAGALPLEMAPALDASVPLQDWVQCDSCQKWRSLPWEIKGDQLPDQWVCSMLNWLPVMNRCDISEDVTTKAVNDLYVVSVPESQVNFQIHADRAALGVTSADFRQLHQSNQSFITDAMPNQGKKKLKPNPVDSSSGLMQTSKLREDCVEESAKSRSLNAPKKYEKHVNEGDMKREKLKNKRESDHETLKKTKIEVAPVGNKIRDSERDGDFGRADLKSSSGLLSRSGGKLTQEYSEQSHSKNGNHGPKDRFVISVKKQKDSIHISLKSGSLDRKTCDQREVHAKKRKLRDWQDSQGYLETSKTNGNHLPDGKEHPEEERSDQTHKKQKKSKISCTQGKESNASKCDDKSYKNSSVTKIILSGTRDNSVQKACEKDQQQSKHRENIAAERRLDDGYSLRKYLAPERFPVAATSSSSKISDSRKRAAFQDIRGSPVESVSSSPMRVFNSDKLYPTQRDISVKDDSKNGDSIIQTPRKSLDREANVETDRSGTGRSREASNRNVLDPHGTDARQNFVGKSESKVKHISRSGNSHLVSNVADTLIGQRKSCTDIHVSNNCNVEGRISKKNESDGATFPQKSGKKSSLHSKDKNKSSNLQRVKVKVSDPSSERELTKKIHMKEVDIERHGVDSRPEDLTDVRHQFINRSSTKSIKDGKSVGEKGCGILASDCRREQRTDLGEFNVSEVKVDDICRVERRHTLHKNVIHGFEVEFPKEKVLTMVESTEEKSDISQSPVDKGFDHSVGNMALDCSLVWALSVPCAVKEDISGNAAKNAFKEAEVAKDFADRVKDAGYDFGHNEAYFDAALKFLQCASLLEACSSDGRRVEMDQMQVYSITAKLCKTCAQEFEKQKKMVAAALAYKCMEVAYLKLVYCKSVSSRKDRHDLEASLQMIPPGESPSSDVSDIDNLNNHTAMDKASLSRGNPHAGNHVIVARNRPNFIRLLDFTNDANSAMEASRKSQEAFAAANLENALNKEGIVSVKKVIDLSFQDVEELVRLVHHASEAISRPGFSGNRG